MNCSELSLGVRALIKTYKNKEPIFPRDGTMELLLIYTFQLKLKFEKQFSSELYKTFSTNVESCTINNMARHWSSRIKGEKPRGLNLTYETLWARALEQKSHGTFSENTLELLIWHTLLTEITLFVAILNLNMLIFIGNFYFKRTNSLSIFWPEFCDLWSF